MNGSDPITEFLEKKKNDHCLRSIPGQEGKASLDLLSNDYLGLGARSKEFMGEFLERFGDAAPTSSASRLLQRDQKYHNMLEDKLGELYGRPALLFNSGYHTNTGVIQALGSLPDTLLVADKLIHASAIDGMRLSSGNSMRFRHNDTESLRRLLQRHASAHRLTIVAAESLYSMDGDIAPLRELVEIKHEFPNILLYLDEAHGFGVRGKKGLGLCEETGLIPEIDIIAGTLGKAAASAGAFVVANDKIRTFLINAARSFIFSTSLPPWQHAWTILMIEKILEMEASRLHLGRISAIFAKEIERLTGDKNPSSSQIVPYITGDAGRAISIAEQLRGYGYDVLPIRRPTVAAGGERIRFSLNAGIKEEEVGQLAKTLSDIVDREGKMQSK